MSTPTKSTLFRFVTTRAPELIAESAKERYYVKHPAPAVTGHFQSLIADPIGDQATRLEQWRNLADTFGSFNSAEELNEFTGQTFADFANWLAKNARAVSENTVLFSSFPGYEELVPLEPEQEYTLWDNLFYQLITNKSPHLRDQVIQMLIASHFLSSSALPDQNKTALARVILPRELFDNDVPQEGSGGGSSTVFTRPLQKHLDAAVAKNKIRQYAVVVEELKKAQQIYEKANLQAYVQAKASYDQTTANALAENTTIDPNTFEARTIPVALEPFSFTPAAEISTEILNQQLSAESSIIAGELNLTTLTTFAEAIETVNNEIAKQNAAVFNASHFSDRIVNLNNIILPADDTLVLPGQQYGFMMKAVKTGSLHKIYVAINMGYPDADAVHVTSNAILTNGTQSSNVFTDYASRNTLVLELFKDGLAIPSGNNSFRVYGEITLSNGIKLSYDITLSLANGSTGRMLVTSGAVTPGNDEYFIPSGFGIKRLGIADYRRVEQTVCCYVPGEVSHIENVMAREYKEKSTRRLRRSEETTTTEKTLEKEHLTDTTSTSRYEMQQQVAEVISEDVSSGVSTNNSFNAGPVGAMSLATNFAYNSSSQQSNSQALTYAKEITERAQERVVQKVREERISKIIEEFEEQNKHGFDNRKGDQHVSGVYRWVDKIYKNQIFNYGKRLMYEFLIPQPAIFHTEAMKSIVNSPSAVVLEKPVDPRTRDLKDFREINEGSAAYWAAIYNAETEVVPETTLRVSKSFQLNSVDMGGAEIAAKAEKIVIPEGYKAVSAVVNYMFYFHPTRVESSHIVVTVGDKRTPLVFNSTYFNNNFSLYFDQPIHNEVGVGIEAGDMAAVSYNVVINCVRTDQYYKQWQLNTFNAILEAYEKKLTAYNEALAASQVGQGAKGTNPLFYRQIENTVLRKNCITYLVGQNNIGRNFYSSNVLTDLQPDLTPDMDRYGALVKFIEQAFEWDVMSYTFYPFYWGNKEKWQSLYQQEVSDSLFRSFLQSGMARVIVTVRPGFEEAIMHYMKTGQVWNGGQVPVVGDDLYLSIVEELKNPAYYVEDTWETRVPTTLTVIQSNSVGFDAAGLPCDCGGVAEITNSNALIGGPTAP